MGTKERTTALIACFDLSPRGYASGLIYNLQTRLAAQSRINQSCVSSIKSLYLTATLACLLLVHFSLREWHRSIAHLIFSTHLSRILFVYFSCQSALDMISGSMGCLSLHTLDES